VVVRKRFPFAVLGTGTVELRTVEALTEGLLTTSARLLVFSFGISPFDEQQEKAPGEPKTSTGKSCLPVKLYFSTVRRETEVLE
jgi:hypothetical protein